jgi:hypothetical protein
MPFTDRTPPGRDQGLSGLSGHEQRDAGLASVMSEPSSPRPPDPRWRAEEDGPRGLNRSARPCRFGSDATGVEAVDAGPIASRAHFLP